MKLFAKDTVHNFCHFLVKTGQSMEKYTDITILFFFCQKDNLKKLTIFHHSGLGLKKAVAFDILKNMISCSVFVHIILSSNPKI